MSSTPWKAANNLSSTPAINLVAKVAHGVLAMLTKARRDAVRYHFQPRHCEERSDEATQQAVAGLRLGCFVLLRTPRNDGAKKVALGVKLPVGHEYQ